MRLLIVEDEVKIANSLKRGLASEGFSVDLSHDGLEGEELAKGGEYDLIILDLMLPGKDGISILRSVRAAKLDTPILILTARDALENKVEGLNAGADDYLPKPFAFSELLARIQAILRRGAGINGNQLAVDDLQLDPHLHTVTRKGLPIALSAKEFSILEYLIKHKGGILSAEQIVKHVWDYNYEDQSNVVAVHMKNLRQKIDKAFAGSKPLIRTIRGLGYKINGE